MADYPVSVYAPRTKENLAGVVYDAGKKTVGFVEDMTYLEDEVLGLIADLVGTGHAAGLKGGAADFYSAWIAEHSNTGIHTSITSDTIGEGPGGDGVTIDGCKMKDGSGIFTGDIYSTPWSDWVSTLQADSATVPTYTAQFDSRYRETGKLVNFYLTWRNTSGGVAGSGATSLKFSLPVAMNTSYLTGTATVIGYGWVYEGGGTTEQVLIVVESDGLNARMYRFNSIASISPNDQSSAERTISLVGCYEAA